ncbi:unnamed protein product [Boreogadus saida]
MSALYGSLRAQRRRGERGSTREQSADLKVSSQKQSLEGKHFLKMAGMANLILRGREKLMMSCHISPTDERI